MALDQDLGSLFPKKIVSGAAPDSPSTSALPREIDDRLIALAGLPADWDSSGASPVSERALSETRRVLRLLYAKVHTSLSEPFIAPDPEGGLGIEWDLGLGHEVLITIADDGKVTYLIAFTQGIPQEEGSLDSPADFARILQEMRRG